MPSCTAQTEEGWFNCLKNECDVELDTEPSTMAVVLVAIFLDIDASYLQPRLCSSFHCDEIESGNDHKQLLSVTGSDVGSDYQHNGKLNDDQE
ncbi:hypothetical protein V6N13_080729 [Hibiscus sabdariffa]